ncbi:hypothetical protein EC973_000911 [Apophysomyces ossiformis]|uniref:Phosphatidylinositol N-acetylglucosaminyltransferase subunit Y n=1 Tax=Apophysomyces ossiformis TaxID=679940 RepID=A0A8H7BUF5_9FUNG|nr:hypothetical protein EC973_000911 [Apophysomyces ossiformis]
MSFTHRRRPSKSILLPRLSTNNGPGQLYVRRMTARPPETVPDKTYLWGYALLTATILMFFSTMYTLVASKYVPYTQSKFLNSLKDDQYYCLLVPITAIAGIYFIMLNWMGMKFFRHN